MYALTTTIGDLLGVDIRTTAVNAMVPCPVHDGWADRTPSLSINQDTGAWKCHQCGAQGGIFHLARIMGVELGEEFRHDQLIKSLTRLPERDPNFAALSNAFSEALRNSKEGQDVLRAYAKSKGASLSSLVNHFHTGWNAEKGALVFPYWDDDKVPFLRYRWPNGFKATEDNSKRILYNVDDVRMAGTVLICEGESDTHAAYRAARGTSLRVCGSPGAGVSEGTWRIWSLDLLFARRIYIGFDNDEAGDKGAEVAMRMLGMDKSRRLAVPNGYDLSEFLSTGGTLIECGVEESDLQP